MSQTGEDVVDWNMPFASYFKQKKRESTPPLSEPSPSPPAAEELSAVAKVAEQQPDWDNIEWNRLDKLLQGRFVLPQDLVQLRELDFGGVDDGELKKQLDEAVERKASFDADFPRRRAIIDRKLNGAFLPDRQTWLELVNLADHPDIDERVQGALQKYPEATAEAAKKAYIVERLEDKVVGSENFALLMQCPSAKLDRAIDRCPGTRIGGMKMMRGKKKFGRTLKIPSLTPAQLRYISMKYSNR